MHSPTAVVPLHVCTSFVISGRMVVSAFRVVAVDARLKTRSGADDRWEALGTQQIDLRVQSGDVRTCPH
jgi:hypothetical protein